MGSRHQVKRTIPPPPTLTTPTPLLYPFTLRRFANTHEKSQQPPTCLYFSTPYLWLSVLGPKAPEETKYSHAQCILYLLLFCALLVEICIVNNNRGPDGTPYEGGIFPAVLSFPQNYPDAPPSIKFSGQMFHPNSKSL